MLGKKKKASVSINYRTPNPNSLTFPLWYSVVMVLSGTI